MVFEYGGEDERSIIKCEWFFDYTECFLWLIANRSHYRFKVIARSNVQRTQFDLESMSSLFAVVLDQQIAMI